MQLIVCRFCFSFERTNLHMGVRRKGNTNAINFAELFQSKKQSGEAQSSLRVYYCTSG